MVSAAAKQDSVDKRQHGSSKADPAAGFPQMLLKELAASQLSTVRRQQKAKPLQQTLNKVARGDLQMTYSKWQSSQASVPWVDCNKDKHMQKECCRKSARKASVVVGHLAAEGDDAAAWRNSESLFLCRPRERRQDWDTTNGLPMPSAPALPSIAACPICARTSVAAISSTTVTTRTSPSKPGIAKRRSVPGAVTSGLQEKDTLLAVEVRVPSRMSSKSNLCTTDGARPYRTSANTCHREKEHICHILALSHLVADQGRLGKT